MSHHNRMGSAKSPIHIVALEKFHGIDQSELLSNLREEFEVVAKKTEEEFEDAVLAPCAAMERCTSRGFQALCVTLRPQRETSLQRLGEHVPVPYY